MLTFFATMPTGAVAGLWQSVNGIYNLALQMWSYLFVALFAFMTLALLFRLISHK